MEKEVSYLITNTYSTLNSLTHKTKNVWLVCHGMGFLSRNFIKYFEVLDGVENYIIAPQAQSKYYFGRNYKHAGASWLTRENTAKETENIINYMDKVLQKENISNDIKLIALGFSQGVSIIMRYVAKRKLMCSQLVLFAGMIPKELGAENFKFLDQKTRVSLIYGTEDELLSEEKLNAELDRFHEIFAHIGKVITFNGKHEINQQVIRDLISNS